VSYFCVTPKSSEKEVLPKEFFGLWMPFCQDFKELWKREQKRISKDKCVISTVLDFLYLEIFSFTVTFCIIYILLTKQPCKFCTYSCPYVHLHLRYCSCNVCLAISDLSCAYLLSRNYLLLHVAYFSAIEFV